FQVRTSDGYILGVMRMSRGGRSNSPVLLQHGLLVDGATWLVGSAEQSLATILADRGFDVWISNFRGTRFSRRHVALYPENPDFWNWTWDDLAGQDVPSVVNFIVSRTGRRPHYVGHSMGTLVALASLTTGGFRNVKSASLLAPIAFLSHITTPLVTSAANFFLGEGANLLGFAEFDPRGVVAEGLVRMWCLSSGVNCYDLLSALTGRNCCLNSSTVDEFLKNEPQSTATKNLIHFSQGVRDGDISKYDYGDSGNNLKHYNSATPPVYDLSRIPADFPLFVSYGGNDALSDREDVGTLLGVLKSRHRPEELRVQYVDNYGHMDFIMAVNANRVVYKPLVDFI
ncbi:triacylglycerol lipase 2, partial [Genlisea aurea]